MAKNCVICGAKLEDPEDSLCEKCYVAEMKRDCVESAKRRAEEQEESEEWDMGWRFRDSRGRSVF